jgi:hypothetical protein
MFCAPGFFFGGIEGVGSRFHVLCSRNSFRHYRGRQVPFSCLARPDSFLAVPKASGPIFMFCASGLVFGSTEGVPSHFHVFRSRTCFRLYRGRQVPFSCFARPKSFSEVPRASVPVFIFCAPGLIFIGTEVVGFRFHLLLARPHFRRCRGRRVSFSCFARPKSFSAVPTASAPVFMFCAPGLIFVGTEGVGSRFHLLRARPCFQPYRGYRPTCFARPESFSEVPRASGPVFMFCAPGVIFIGTEGVGSRFHLLRARPRFQRCRVRRVPFSCFARLKSFSAVPMASGPVFMFCAPELVFGGTVGVRSCFHVLRSETRFRRCRVRLVPFSCFALPDSFSTVPRASDPVFMFCAPEIIFDGTDGVGSNFHVLRARTRFKQYRGRRVPFSCIARPNSFLAVPWASGPVFMFCAL